MMNLNEEDKEILLEFISESNEAIQNTEVTLLKLEESLQKTAKIEPKLIDGIFRTFHSIKGSAEFIGLSNLSSITHVAENLLDLIRKNKTELKKAHIDIFLELCDVVQLVLEHVHENLTEENFNGDLGDLKSRLQDLIDEKPEPTAKKVTGKKTKAKKEEPVKEEKEKNRTDSFFTPEMVQQFFTESQELLDSLEEDLLELEKNSDSKELIENAFRSMHSLKGNAGLFNYKDIQSVCHKAESFLDKVRSGDIKANSKQISLILQVLDFIRQAIEIIPKGKEPIIPGRIGLIDLMDEMFSDPESEGAPQPTEPETVVEKVEEKEPQKTEETVETKEVKSEKKNQESEKIDKNKEEATGSLSKINEVIRVDVNKLNQLMDLVGEIVVAESMVSQNPALEDAHIEGFEKSIANLQKNVRELQELATSMRMIPLSGLFSKMKRLVRDISSKSSKNVDLEILGGETEVDRTVIESISDPLVHIFRNSIDHGIESEKERIKSGKSKTGKIHLEAKRVGGEIWIEILDDGAGLDKDKIMKKAIEKGLIQESEEDIADKIIFQLIFAAGFSTAAKVTNISGRGVGMDVVRRNIEKIRGRIDVNSKMNEGTTITLKIPLTTAIIDGMLMRVGDAVYAIPTLDIKESLQVNENDVIDLIDGQEVVNIRNELIPVLRLTELHHLDGGSASLSEGIVVVAENAGRLVGFLIDEIIGQQQLVIKNLSDYVGDIKGVSGCSVLGDGSICLILDLSNMIKIAESQSESNGVSN